MDVLTAQAKELRLSATLEINELVQARLSAGKKVVHLGFGEATFPIPESVRNAHAKASSNTSYLPVAGLNKLREVCFAVLTFVCPRNNWPNITLSPVDREVPIPSSWVYYQSGADRSCSRIKAALVRAF